MKVKAKIEYFSIDEKLIAVLLNKTAERIIKTTGTGACVTTAIFSNKNNLDNFINAANLKSKLGVRIAKTRRLLF